MLSEIKEPGPGFDYFLNTPCNDWDVVQYHEFWKKSNFGLDKASVTRRFNTQLQKIKEQGTEEEKNNAIRLEKQFQVSVLPTHGTLPSHGYGLRLRCWLQLPMELHLRIVMDFVSAVVQLVDSKKMGRIDNFWLKSLPRMKQHNAVENNEINAENVFLSCDLSRGSLQIGGAGNIIQGHKRSYENGKQPIDEIIAIRRGKKQKPAETTIEDGKSQTPERQRNVEDETHSSPEERRDDGSLFSPNCHNDSDVGHGNDNNPFIAQTGEGSTKYKVVLSWSHAIDNVVINNVSKNDWITPDGYNISTDFRKLQVESIEKLKTNPILSYAKEIDMILCLSSIMYCNELKPEYVKCSEKIWKDARPRLLIPKELPTVADLVIIEYNRLLSDKEQLNTKWRNNWAKGNTLLTSEDKDIFDCVQIVARNFITYLSSVSYNENKKMDEDTFVHRYCHQILEEIFNKAEFSLVWANGESESSKERRLLDGHNHGRKPDFRILVNIEEADRELIFGEIKPPHCTIAVNQRIIKLAEFMKGSLDYLINVYGYMAGLETYGILICGSEIKIFSTDLTYDGLYRCNLISKVLLPTENANFLNIITVVSTLYSLLERVKSTINTIISSHLPTGSSLNRHSYCRKSNSSPKKIRVPIA
ncbi:unnamed protein product [Rhizophagus irregularis]|uniref:Uncharacterized protein n=1 Tax=Rhizophagus irregularis TaxID=588596 RepID=A0A916EKD9_9GLOM|nr:unnamed protein product [Rhizophagus irregularis]